MRTSTLTCLIVTFIAFNPSNAKQTQAISDILNIDDHLVVAGVICFIASSISNAGGIGGGGLFIPILTIIAGLDLKTASSFSAFMVTGGSFANVMFNMFTTSPKFGGKSLIHYDIALSSEPSMLLGVSVGVICNIVFPEWFITVMFALFLAWSTTKTCKNGMVLWKVESEEMMRENGVLENVTSGLEEALLVDHEQNRKMKIPWLKLWVLLLIWLSFCSIYILHGNRYGKGIIPMEPCGAGYWFLSSVQVPLALVFTAWVVLRKQSLQDQTLEHEDLGLTRNRESSKLIFPMVALIAGILGGVFGIGGGMLINPLLLQLGIPPEVTSATCSLMVFFSSSMSAFQYMLLGVEHIQIALIFGIMCFVASLVGLLMVKRAIKKYGRVSLIVFSVSIVMTLSTILMTTFGAIKVLRDYKSGTSMGFKLPVRDNFVRSCSLND